MANCHYLFQDFNQKIKLTEPRRQALLSARDDLRTRVNSNFQSIKAQLPSVHEIQFQTQGSFIMDTIINPLSEDYDLDDGIYFIGSHSRNNRPATKYFHDFVIKSITQNNLFLKKVIDKDTCVRAFYKEGYSILYENKTEKLDQGFHIDLPIYYSTTKKSPDLAHLKTSWLVSDPIEFIDWFEKKVKSSFRSEYLYDQKLFSDVYNVWQDRIRKEDAQLRKIIRYLKAWCDYRGNEMPCGIVLTILGANNYQANVRDDVALRDTLINIQNALNENFVCLRPTTPVGDDLLASYENKLVLKNNLSSFVESAKQAVNETNPKRACAKWQLHLGNRFSCFNVQDIEETAQSFTKPAIITTNAKSA